MQVLQSSPARAVYRREALSRRHMIQKPNFGLARYWDDLQIDHTAHIIRRHRPQRHEIGISE